MAAWIIQPMAVLAGRVGFTVLHAALLLALPRRVAMVVAISFPFWVDVLWGGIFTLVFVAAYWALRGNRAGVIAYVVLTLLMPRPVQFPLLLWLLWHDRWVRGPAVALVVGHLALVLASGFAGEWMARLLESSANEMAMGYNLGPTRLFGVAWLVVGVPLGIVAFRRHPAWAGLLIAPYLLGQYWLMALAGLPDAGPEKAAHAIAVAAARAPFGGSGSLPTPDRECSNHAEPCAQLLN